MPIDPSSEHADEAVQRIARDAGLDALFALDPALVARAQALAQAYAKRLQRPHSPLSEPAHVYLARRNA